MKDISEDDIDVGLEKWKEFNTVYTSQKAGMSGADKKKIQKAIYELSKGTSYYLNEERKKNQTAARISQIRDKIKRFNKSEIIKLDQQIDIKISELENNRDLTQVWCHVDMDAFFASVEEKFQPELKEKAMAVGSKSMISTANYKARTFGVRSAMPGFIAKHICPQLIIIPPNFEKYQKASREIREIFVEYDIYFQSSGLDEASLNITKYCHHFEITPKNAVEELRRKVYEKTGLTCSAGIAPNRLLAKVASDMKKPNGQYLINSEKESVLEFVSKLPLRKIPGIGQVTEEILGAFNFKTCSDLIERKGVLSIICSERNLPFFLSVGLGIGPAARVDDEVNKNRKGLSIERTFTPTDDQDFLLQKLEELSLELSERLKNEEECGHTLTLKVKLHTFETKTKAHTLKEAIISQGQIYNEAVKLLNAQDCNKIRLLGIRISNFNFDKKQKKITEYFIPSKLSSESFYVDNDMLSLNERKRTLDESMEGVDFCLCDNCERMVRSVDYYRHLDLCYRLKNYKNSKRKKRN